MWLRHLVTAEVAGLPTDVRTMVELGPGDSLGVSLCAFLSGVDTVYALDVVPFAARDPDAGLFDDLVRLFEARTPIPDQAEFPRVRPALHSYDFPGSILGQERLDRALTFERLDAIRSALANPARSHSCGVSLRYLVPWDRASVPQATADLVLSQAVMQYVPDLDEVYGAMCKWLKPGGWMSHAIDFKSHGTASTWDGHWSYSPFVWRVANLRQRYRLNRQPHSAHIDAITRNGFACVTDSTTTADPQCRKTPYVALTTDDRRITGSLIQAAKCGAVA